MEKHSREPIEHTCPNIDRYIKDIKYDTHYDRHLRCMDHKALYDVALVMSARLEDCICYLEELRNSNHTLRGWGIEEAANVDSLEKYVEKLEAKINDYGLIK